jgi:hypothetical protein
VQGGGSDALGKALDTAPPRPPPVREWTAKERLQYHVAFLLPLVAIVTNLITIGHIKDVVCRLPADLWVPERRRTLLKSRVFQAGFKVRL